MIQAVAPLLRRAALQAARAPSIHNTQPWRFMLTAAALEVRADRARQLTVLDPRARQLLISCGCALLHARVAVEAAGYRALVRRFPDENDPDLVARVQLGAATHSAEGAALDRAVEERRTNRRTFLGDPPPLPLVRELQRLGRREGVEVIAVTQPEHRAAILRLNERADEIERADPAYLDEIHRWTTDDLRRPDGVQAASVPHASNRRRRAARAGTTIRGFDLRGMGWLPPADVAAAEALLLFCCGPDQPYGWLRVGEALERVWLTLTDRGYWASPLTQPVEVRRTRDELVAELGLRTLPQVLLRVGRAPAVLPTNRRDPAEVIAMSTAS